MLELLGPTMVWIYPDYIEIDHHGRGCDKIFGEGSEKETLRLAKLHQKHVFEKRAQQKVTEYVDCDLYGRGDPRVFGEKAHLANKEEALTSLKEVREKSGKKDKFRAVLAFPSFSPFLFGKRLGSKKVQPAKIAAVIAHDELPEKNDAIVQLKVPDISEVTLLEPETEDEVTILVEIPWEESKGPLRPKKTNIRERIALLEETETEVPSLLTQTAAVSKKVLSPANAISSKYTFTPKGSFKERTEEKDADNDTVSSFQDDSPIKENSAISGPMETVDSPAVKVKDEAEPSLDMEISSTDSGRLGTDTGVIAVSESSQSSGSSKEYKSCASSKDECQNESAKLLSSDRGANVLGSTSESPAETGLKVPAVTGKQRVIDLDRLGENLGKVPSSAPILQNESSGDHTDLKLGAAGASSVAAIGVAIAFEKTYSSKSDLEVEASCTASSEEMFHSEFSDVFVSVSSQKSSKAANTKPGHDVASRTSSKNDFDDAEARQRDDTSASSGNVESRTLSKDVTNAQHDETEKNLTGQASTSGSVDEEVGVVQGIVERNLALFGNDNTFPVQPRTTGADGPSASTSTSFAATLQAYNPLSGIFISFGASTSANEAAPAENVESYSDVAASVPAQEVIIPPQQGGSFAPFKSGSEAMETAASPTTPDAGLSFKRSSSEAQKEYPKSTSSSSEVAPSSSNDMVRVETVEIGESEGSSGMMVSKSSSSAVNSNKSSHVALSDSVDGPSVLDGAILTSFGDNVIVAGESSSSEHGSENDGDVAAPLSSTSSAEVNLSSSNGTPSAETVESSESANSRQMEDSESWRNSGDSSSGKAAVSEKRDDGAVSESADLSVSDSTDLTVSSSSEAAVSDSTGAVASSSSGPAVSDSSTEAGNRSDSSDIIVSSSSGVEKSGSESAASSDEFCDVVDNEDDLRKFMSS